MQKRTIFIFITLVLSVVSFLIRGDEHRPSGPELFTRYGGGFGIFHLQIGQNSEPQPVASASIARRQHFGFPCYALIADTSHAGNTYASLDAPRLSINVLLAAIVASGISALFSRTLRLKTAFQAC